MIRTSPSIRAIALAEFSDCLAHAEKKARAAGAGWDSDPHNQRLQLWLAIALAAGVGRDLPDRICAKIEVEAFFPYREKRLPRASAIAPEAEWKAELVRHRDALRARAEGSTDQRLIQRALDATWLAECLGAPPVTSAASFEGKEAA